MRVRVWVLVESRWLGWVGWAEEEGEVVGGVFWVRWRGEGGWWMVEGGGWGGEGGGGGGGWGVVGLGWVGLDGWGGWVRRRRWVKRKGEGKVRCHNFYVFT